jgi:hypothetical protein
MRIPSTGIVWKRCVSRVMWQDGGHTDLVSAYKNAATISTEYQCG